MNELSDYSGFYLDSFKTVNDKCYDLIDAIKSLINLIRLLTVAVYGKQLISVTVKTTQKSGKIIKWEIARSLHIFLRLQLNIGVVFKFYDFSFYQYNIFF